MTQNKNYRDLFKEKFLISEGACVIILGINWSFANDLLPTSSKEALDRCRYLNDEVLKLNRDQFVKYIEYITTAMENMNDHMKLDDNNFLTSD